MQPDDELCLCFHVTLRKVQNFLRLEKPKRVGQISECFGAGTGCGWCRPFLQKLFDQASAARASDGETAAIPEVADLPDRSEYAQDRSRYVRAGRGTPPAGATPLSEDAD